MINLCILGVGICRDGTNGADGVENLEIGIAGLDGTDGGKNFDTGTAGADGVGKANKAEDPDPGTRGADKVGGADGVENPDTDIASTDRADGIDKADGADGVKDLAGAVVEEAQQRLRIDGLADVEEDRQ